MKITVIGELCTDIFVYGETKRLSPEAPVPVFNPLYIDRNFGMGGNVVENLKSLNQDVWVKHISQFQPIKKTRYVDDKSNHMFIRVDEGEETITPLELTDSIIDEIVDISKVIDSSKKNNNQLIAEKYFIRSIIEEYIEAVKLFYERKL